MGTVIVDERFLGSAYSLPKEIGRKVYKALHLYSRNPDHPSPHREKLSGKADGLFSIRVDDNYRIIFRQVGPAPVLMDVAKHDEAYRSAETRPSAPPEQQEPGEHPFAPRLRRLEWHRREVELDDVAHLVGTRKYLPLAQILLAAGERTLSLSFAQISEIIGEQLPASAMKYRAWWANNRGRHVQASAWLGVGYVVDDVNLAKKLVVFAPAQDSRRSRPGGDH